MRRARLVSVPGLSLPYQLRISFTRSDMAHLLPAMKSSASATSSGLPMTGHPLVGRGRVNGHDPLTAGGGAAARLLGEKAHGRRLVLEAQLARRLAAGDVGGIEEDAALEQRPVEVGDERADVAGG